MEDRSRYPAELRSAADARHHAEAVLQMWGIDSITDAARLLISELVINAVLHAGTDAELVLSCRPGCLRVEVADASPRVPVPRSYGPESPTGRGLMILDDVADEWGVDVRDSGKAVWFELAFAEPLSSSEVAPVENPGDNGHHDR